MRALIPYFISDQYRSGQFAGDFEAISLFVDITGFTTLTENLMQHGKDGVEELSAALNGVFSPLVHAVYAQGGFITTFAGDAFTALFPVAKKGDNAARRAAQAALNIRDFIRDHTTVSTPYGTFQLSAKVGLGKGKVEWSIIGEGERHTYLFRGSAIDSCLAAQQGVESGHIGIASRLGRQLSNVAEISTQHDLSELHSASFKLPDQKLERPVMERADLHPFILNAVIDFQAQAEFRSVVSIFISFEWLDLQASQLFVKEVLAQAALYGGYFNKLDYSDKGTVMLLVFGAPTTYANDLVRAANFLLALRRAVPVVRWRAGITYGTVYAGFLGGAERSEYTVIGDAVNLSARQMDKAAWGETWISAAAADGLRQASYGLDPVGSMSFKGKRDTIEVFRLIGPAQRRAETRQIVLQLVGRHTELDRLREWLTPLQNKRFAGVVTVYGEAGMGKSHLVFKFMSTASQYNWLYCPTDEIFQQSLNPFRAFLRRYFDQSEARTAQHNQFRFDTILNNLIGSLPISHGVELGLELERVRPFLAALVDIRSKGSLYEQLEPKLRFDNMLVAIKALFLAESLRQPIIIHIEDAHWLDVDSRQLLKILTRNIAAYPIVVLMTSRYQDDGKPYDFGLDEGTLQHDLDLVPLPSHDIRVLAEQMLEAPVDEQLAGVLATKASGNPLFIEQLALDLRERGALVMTPNGTWSIPQQEIAQVPSSISAVLIARLDRLVAEVRTVVYTATVLGHEFEVRVLSAMLKNDAELLAKVQRAESEAIWSPLDEIRYIFRHALLRDAAYDMQLRSRLRELHRLAEDAIEQVYAADLQPHYVDLVYHANRANDPARETHYAKLAGEQAAARFANTEAIKYYSRVLELTPDNDPATRFEIILARESVYNILGAREEQTVDLDSLQALAERMDDNDKRAEVLLRRAMYAEITGDYKASIAAAEQITTLVDAPRLKANGYYYWGLGLVRQAAYEVGSVYLEQASEIAKANNLPQIEADARRGRGIIAINVGDFSLASSCFEQSLKSYEAAGNRRGMNNIANNLGTTAFSTGDYPKALTFMQQAAKGFLDTGDRFGESVVNNNMGSVFALLRNYVAALTYTERSLYVAYEIGNRRSALHSLANLSTFAVMLGDLDRAERIHSDALEMAQEMNDREKQGFLIASHVLANHYRGAWDTAYTDVQSGLRLMEEINLQPIAALLLTIQGHVESDLRRWEDAESSYERAFHLNTELGEHHLAVEPRAGLARVALALGNPVKAVEQVEAILEHLKTATLDGTGEPILVYLTCYKVLEAIDDPRAAELLQQAYTTLQDMVSKIPDDTQRQMFLNNIPHHREFMTIWNKANPDTGRF
ncbi:MAG: adenylate/guanylate cyclase domain-containing protein [Chloroflexota bacterium]